MPKLLVAFVLFLLASYFEKSSKNKQKKPNEIKYEEVEFRDSEYGRMKDKIKNHAEKGYSEFIDAMDHLNFDENVNSKEKEYEKMQEELRYEIRKMEDFQRQLEIREKSIKLREEELENIANENQKGHRNDIVNGIIFSEILKRPKF